MLEYDPSRVALYSPQERDTLFVDGGRYSDLQLAIEAARLAYFRAERSTTDHERLKEALRRVGFEAPALFNGAATDSHAFGAFRPSDATALIAFRGTRPDAIKDLITDIQFQLVDWPEAGGRVHLGFALAFRSLHSQIQQWLQSGSIRSGRLILTGHSLGAALATLAASIWSPALLLTVGSPRVGNEAFVEKLSATRTIRFIDCCDVVTDVPPVIGGYRHVGLPAYIARDGTVLENPKEALIAADRAKAGVEYLSDAWKFWKNVASRQLADHTPINYARPFF